jgi:hypothetical protein
MCHTRLGNLQLSDGEMQSNKRLKSPHQRTRRSMGVQPGVGVNGSAAAFNFVGAQQQRCTQLAQQGLTGMGGMGGNIRTPGKSSLSLKLIFSRLQGELQKTKDTGAELQNITHAFGEIQETLEGALVRSTSILCELYVDASAFSRRICLLHLTRSLPFVHLSHSS